MKWLSGDKIRLRAVESSDLELLLEWENDTQNWEVSGTLTPFSKDLMKKYIENTHLSIYQAGQYRFMIEIIEEKNTVGIVDIFDFDPFHKRAGIGILIGRKEDRTHGYSTEALQLLRTYCFEHLELHQLYCNISAENEASKRLFEKLGFQVSGIKKDWNRSGNTFKDEYFLQLVNSDH